MKVQSHISYLCGSFSIREDIQEISAIDARWQRVYCEQKEFDTYLRYYYPEFVEFCRQTEGNVSPRSVAKYRMAVDQEFAMTLSDGVSYRVHIGGVSLYLMPGGMLIYAVELTQDNADLNAVTAALWRLRDVNGYSQEILASSFGEIFVCLDAVYSRCAGRVLPMQSQGGYAHLVENGNKLKLFQIAVLPEAIPDKEHEALLFELGTLAPIGSYNENSLTSMSAEYFRSIMEHNKIAVYNNWKGLSLLDTFTIVAFQVKPYLIENWKNDYFEMLYLHSIYIKFYLYRTNLYFRKNVQGVSTLIEEAIDFERAYYFNKISYNFLPLEIHKALNVGLEIEEEKHQLYHLIAQENDRREKRDDQRMNNMLFFLSCLTVFSTVWDFTCLFNEMHPYEGWIGNATVGYRLLAYPCLLLILIAIFLTRYHRKK